LRRAAARQRRCIMEPRHQSRAHALGAIQAAVLLATLAGTGHTAAERGLDRVVHLCVDALHLLAAGAWLGSLFPLIFLLGRCACTASAEALDFAARATQRFSPPGWRACRRYFSPVSSVRSTQFPLSARRYERSSHLSDPHRRNASRQDRLQGTARTAKTTTPSAKGWASTGTFRFLIRRLSRVAL
jgi:hypothetical protein